MKNYLLTFASSCILISILTSQVSAKVELLIASGNNITACKKNEKIVFSCMRGNRKYSVCASQDLSKTSGSLTYRVANKNNQEMQFPEKPSHPKGLFFYEFSGVGGGGSATLSFANNGYDYELYSVFSKTLDSSTISVEKNGTSVSHFTCNALDAARLISTPTMDLMQDLNINIIP